MARNGSGTYSKINTFVAGNTITASGHNQNWDDIATEMTNSVAADGQTSMTGPLKASNGTNSAPSFTFASDTNTGWYRSGSDELAATTGGTQRVKITSAGLDITSGGLLFGGVSGVALTGVNITSATALTAPATDDELPIYDLSATTNKKITLSDLLKVINSLTADATPARASDYVVTYDASASGPKKVLLSAVGTPPPPGSFKSLVIKVTGNTGVDVDADFVTTTDGTSYQTTAVNSSINMATTGADALDSGSIAQATWYAIWVIAKADGTTACLASTSASAPTMPADYTFKARVGWVRTAAGSAQLKGTWQFGRRAQYIVGLAQTTNSAALQIGTSTSTSFAAMSISAVVPTTASEIYAYIRSDTPTAATQLAPNSSYTSGQAPILTGGATNQNPDGFVNMLIESSNIYVMTGSGTVTVYCNGWVDNI